MRVFLTSVNPERTASSHSEIAELELERVGRPDTCLYWKLDAGGMQLAIHDARNFAECTYPARGNSNATHVYFKIKAQDRVLEHLRELGVTPDSTDDVVVTVIDPDG